MTTRVAAVLLLAALLAPGVSQPALAQTERPKNVLVLHLGAETFPANPALDRGIHEAFVAHPELPISYYAEYLESDFRSPDHYLAFKDYLRRKFAGMPIDVVIACTDPVLRFAIDYRAELFPNAPIVFWGLRLPDDATRQSGAGITGVQIGLNYADTLKFAMTLQPELRRVYVVANHPDNAVQTAARAVLEQVPGVSLTYLDATTVRDLEKSVRSVPAGSAILYVWHGQFQPGEVIYTDEVGRRVATASPVPVYSASEPMFGNGVVGGVVRSSQETGAHVGELAMRVLAGKRPQDIPFEVASVSPMVDWRELQQWKIPTSRLPAGTRVMFRETSVWERYRYYVVGAILLLSAQAILIGALLVQRSQRKQAVEDLRRSYGRVRDLGARLLNAQDEERARIARELHDDISQRLAVLKIELTLLSRSKGPDAESLASQALERADGIATDLRDLSHRLHPARLRLMGLIPAIAGLQNEMSRPGVTITMTHGDVPPAVRPAVTIALFRVAQEALQNALKYSHSPSIAMHLAESNGQIVLTIADRGAGFDLQAASGKGLGLTSMRERVDALGGTLDIRSIPGGGTTIEARVPVAASADAGQMAG